ncbi:MAG: hypothetical protein KF830_16195 [Planctomycetes bacterium]|nr:hypothetical protein [Planctomycetota bacterium]
MARWALFAAHRYVQGGVGAPRQFGPDGRALQRPWRTTAPEVAARAVAARATRRQPLGPRLVGALLLGVAGWAALHPVGPVPRHVAACAAARPGAALPRLQTVAPAGLLTAPPAEFRWQHDGAVAPCTVVLCAADYVPLARGDATEVGTLAVPAAFAAHLAAAGTFHWYVESAAAGAVVRSGLESFTIR